MSAYGSSSYGNNSYGYTAPSATYGYTAAPVNAEPQDNALANPLFYAWGSLHMWMFALGYLTYTWYVTLLTSNSWLKQ